MNSDQRKFFERCGKMERNPQHNYRTDYYYDNNNSQSDSNSYQKNADRGQNNSYHNHNYGNFSGTNDDTECYQVR